MASGNSCSIKTFACPECKKQFSKKNYLNSHMRVHTGERPFPCKNCGKSFTQSNNLKMHQRIHTGEKPFSCSICQKLFRLKGHLKSHMRFHTGERPFRCENCGMCYKHSSHLKVHQRIHTGEKSFPCSMCQKSFAQKRDLTIHIEVHTKERAFRYKKCGKMFKELCHLEKHQVVQTSDKHFSSSADVKTFIEKSNLEDPLTPLSVDKSVIFDACNKQVKDKYLVKKHLYTHTAEETVKTSGKESFPGRRRDRSPYMKEANNSSFPSNSHSKTFNYERDSSSETLPEGSKEALFPNYSPWSDQELRPRNPSPTHLESEKYVASPSSSFVPVKLAHNGSNPFVCCYCKKPLYAKSKLYIHVRKNHMMEKQKNEENNCIPEL